MRLIAGKVLMDRNAPEPLQDGPNALDECRELIERWHGSDRLAYAVTPRFALSCTPAQLSAAGALLSEYAGLYLHSHLAEHPDEISATLASFPDAAHYVDVYRRFGMLGDRSVFAHGIHLSDDELSVLARAGAGIAFCPTSNLFLGSGLLDLPRLDAAGVRHGIATDVGAGTSLSLLRTLGEGYKVQQLKGYSWHPLLAFYEATAGNARLLSLETRIGQLAAGFDADLVVLEPAPGSLLAERATSTNNLHEKLFACMTLGGGDAVRATYVNGQPVYRRSDA